MTLSGTKAFPTQVLTLQRKIVSALQHFLFFCHYAYLPSFIITSVVLTKPVIHSIIENNSRPAPPIHNNLASYLLVYTKPFRPSSIAANGLLLRQHRSSPPLALSKLDALQLLLHSFNFLSHISPARA